jgi:predicted nucleotidyltransferase
MSGSFTQRGNAAILDKFTRAKHAILAGADVVLELPAPFASAPAEIFAKGAIKIADSLNCDNTLAFGCETPADFLTIAKSLLDENYSFKNILEENLKEGNSFAKSYCTAASMSDIPQEILAKPNNILAVEYAKAIFEQQSNIQMLPIQRLGSGYNDGSLKENYSSATAIRANLKDEIIAANVPQYVFDDLKSSSYDKRAYEYILHYALLSADINKLKDTFGCAEGLESKIKNISNMSTEDIIKECTSKRYSSSRIRRILLNNALNFSAKQTLSFLQGDLYLKPLAINAEKKNDILSLLGNAKYPLAIRQMDLTKLSTGAKSCFDKSTFTDGVWDIMNRCKTYNYTLKEV